MERRESGERTNQILRRSQAVEANENQKRNGRRTGIDAETEKIISMLIAERIACSGREWGKTYPEEERQKTERIERWEALLKEQRPEILRENSSFADSIIAVTRGELEGLYLFGLKDGVRLMRALLRV